MNALRGYNKSGDCCLQYHEKTLVPVDPHIRTSHFSGATNRNRFGLCISQTPWLPEDQSEMLSLYRLMALYTNYFVRPERDS